MCACVCVCVFVDGRGVQMCHSTHVQVPGQLGGVSSFRPTGPKDKI